MRWMLTIGVVVALAGCSKKSEEAKSSPTKDESKQEETPAKVKPSEVWDRFSLPRYALVPSATSTFVCRCGIHLTGTLMLFRNAAAVAFVDTKPVSAISARTATPAAARVLTASRTAKSANCIDSIV